jgi:hypothetical protein
MRGADKMPWYAKWIMALACLCGLALIADAQTVEVPTALLDRANQSFLETDALRKEVEALKNELKAKDDLILAMEGESAAKDILIIEKNALIFLKDSLIESQNKTIQRLEERDEVRLKEIQALRLLKCRVTSVGYGLVKFKRCT